MGTYNVTDAVLEGEHNFGDGSMNCFVLTLTDNETGQVLENVNHWIGVGKDPFMAGDTIEGEIKNQPRGGIKITRARKAGAGAPASSGGGRPSSGGRSGGRDAAGRSIERQVALKAAAEIGAASIAAGKAVTGDQVAALADKFDTFLRAGSAVEQPAQTPAPAQAPAQQATPATTQQSNAPVADDDDIPF